MASQNQRRVNGLRFAALLAIFCGVLAGPVVGQTTTGTAATAITNAVINFSSLVSGTVLSVSTTNIASSPPAIAFQGMDDDGTQDLPYPQGAVGPNHVVGMFSSGVRISQRDGTILSTVPLQQFWAALGPFTNSQSVFDPRMLYDPFQDRWVAVAMAEENLPSSAVLVGVSQTGDPTGNWNLYRIRVDTNGALSASYPSVGFNTNWIAVSTTAFPISSGSQESQLFLFNKADLYAGGSGHYTGFANTNISIYGNVQTPVATYDETQTNLYLLTVINGNSGSNGVLQLLYVDGALGSEALHVGASIVVPDQWDDNPPTIDFGPQLGSAQLIDLGDSRLTGAVYRNGAIWTAHTIFLPAGAATRSAIQWWQVGTDGTILQRGRIDDSTGNLFYGYPTIAANQNDDALVGYTQFSTSAYPSAYFSFRSASDPTNTLQSEILLKAGEAAYARSDRWGDQSTTVVDPANDTDFWTLQEYGASPLKGISRWGTWWGDVLLAPHVVASNATVVSESCSPNNGVIDPFEHVAIRFSLLNTGGQDATNVVGTLLATDSVVDPAIPHNFGTVTAGGAVATSVLSFLVNAPCGSNIVTSLQLESGTTDLGTVSFRLPVGVANAVLTQNFDSVSAPALPGGWSTSGSGALSGWVTTSAVADTAPNAAFCPDTNVVATAQLVSPSILMTSSNGQLSFRNNYNVETGFDGGVLEIQIGAGSFQDILDAGGSFVWGGYSHLITTNATGSSIGGRAAWSGNSGGWITTIVNLPPTVAGQSIQLRWLFATDSSGGGNGWWIDGVEVDDGGVCCIANSEADLSGSVSAAPNAVLVGSNLTYTVTVTNSGPGIAFDTVVTDTPPSAVTFISATPSQGGCMTDSSGHIICDLKDLTNNTTASISILVNAPAVASLTNVAIVGAFSPDPNPANNTLTNIASAVTPAIFDVLSSSEDFGAAATGGTALISFVITNEGGATLTGTAMIGGSVFGIASNSSFSIAGFSSTNVVISFMPPSLGVFTNDVIFASDAGDSTNVVTGTGAIQPNLSFSGNPTTGLAPLAVTFTDSSTGSYTNQLWSFGDGGTSTLTGPSHSYVAPGIYSVSLTVYGPLGANTLTLTNYIDATPPAPIASFTASPTNGASALSVSFSDTSTGSITNQVWTFGDGGTSASSNPTHLYTSAGAYSVQLMVFGPGGSNALNLPNLITVTNVVTTPAISILRPATGMLYPPVTNMTITIVASASDSHGISTIEFFADGAALGQTASNPATNFWFGPRIGVHSITARATSTIGATNTSAPVAITVGAKNSPLGDWQVAISGADKGVEFLTFEDDFSASGYAIRLKTFGLDDISGHWGFDSKGRVTGPFLEQLGGTTNWDGTLLSTAKSLKTFSGIVTAGPREVFHWAGVPATTFPDLSGTWTGVVTIVRTTTAASYVITNDATDSAVFDVAVSGDPSTVVGQLIVTARDQVYGYITADAKQINLSGTFIAARLSMTLTGLDEAGERVSVKIVR